MTRLSNIRCAVGKWLSKTHLGVFITVHSYIYKEYELYRRLIYESEYSLDEIREFIKKNDHNTDRSDWLFLRSRYTDMHCTDQELRELISYLDD